MCYTAHWARYSNVPLTVGETATREQPMIQEQPEPYRSDHTRKRCELLKRRSSSPVVTQALTVRQDVNAARGPSASRMGDLRGVCW